MNPKHDVQTRLPPSQKKPSIIEEMPEFSADPPASDIQHIVQACLPLTFSELL